MAFQSKQNKNIANDKQRQPICARSEYPQILVGATTGFLGGLLVTKVGKTAALIVGGSILVLEAATLEGAAKVDWLKVSEKISKLGEKIQEFLCGKKTSWFEGDRNFTPSNPYFAISFISGVLLGFGAA